MSMEELPVRRAAHLSRVSRPPQPAGLGYTELKGRLVELSQGHGSAGLSFLCLRVLEAQHLGEHVIWVQNGNSTFFPPDFAANGVDLGALTVVRAPNTRGALRAIHHLLHSGAFGMVVMDIREDRRPVIPGILGRFAHLAEKNGTALIFLQENEPENGLGSMISLRLSTHLSRIEPGVFRCDVEVVKDKRKGPGLRLSEIYHAPAGLR